MTSFNQLPSSFRDPRAHVFELNGRIFRAIYKKGLTDYLASRNVGFYRYVEDLGWLVRSNEVDPESHIPAPPDAILLLEHERIPLITYPYEWTFSQLKDAALLHLDLHMNALKYEINMIDSSAYNIQFISHKPIFIDYCSFAPYQVGSWWAGHNQFCEQFLNPLLLHAKEGIDFQPWYRGTLNGISTLDTFRTLSFNKYLTIQTLIHVCAKEHFDRKMRENIVINESSNKKTKQQNMPKETFIRMLIKLRNFINDLSIGNKKTLWEGYKNDNTYSDDDVIAKHRFVGKYCSLWKISKLIDFGGNSGTFSATAIAEGVHHVVLVDSDQGALTIAYKQAVNNSINILPILSDISNLSPSQGWRGVERQSLEDRLKEWRPDAILALALIHHLTISKNIPIEQALNWLMSFASKAIIEFVPKTDQTVKLMLKYRADIFDDYTLDNFIEIISAKKNIIGREQLACGRTLIAYE